MDESKLNEYLLQIDALLWQAKNKLHFQFYNALTNESLGLMIGLALLTRSMASLADSLYFFIK
jgi:hypothetical protein